MTRAQAIPYVSCFLDDSPSACIITSCVVSFLIGEITQLESTTMVLIGSAIGYLGATLGLLWQWRDEWL